MMIWLQLITRISYESVAFLFYATSLVNTITLAVPKSNILTWLIRTLSFPAPAQVLSIGEQRQKWERWRRNANWRFCAIPPRAIAYTVIPGDLILPCKQLNQNRTQGNTTIMIHCYNKMAFLLSCAKIWKELPGASCKTSRGEAKKKL